MGNHRHWMFDQVVGFRCSEEMLEWLNREAEVEGMNRSKLLVTILTMLKDRCRSGEVLDKLSRMPFRR